VVRPLTPPPFAPIGVGEPRRSQKVELIEYYRPVKFHLRISDRLRVIAVRKFRVLPSIGYSFRDFPLCPRGSPSVAGGRHVHIPISRPRLYIDFPRQFFDISLRSTPVYGRGPMYKVFIVVPSTKSVHGPMGKTFFSISREPTYRSASNFVETKRTSVPIVWHASHNFPFPFPVYRNCESLHVIACGETSKNHNSERNRDSDFRFLLVDSAYRPPSN
jgi:hypothetical protein